MPETFPLRKKKSADLDDDEPSLEIFLAKTTKTKNQKSFLPAIESAEPGEEANFLDVLIFASSVVLWITFAILCGCHITVAIMFLEAYKFMLYSPSLLTFIVLVDVSIILELSAALCTSLCVNYYTGIHLVALFSKVAIGLICFDTMVFIVLLIFETSVTRGLHHSFSAMQCSKNCKKGLEVITHLFVGCTYEAIAVNVCVLPVIVCVLMKTTGYVQHHHKTRQREKEVRGSPSSLSNGYQQKAKVTFSTSTSSISETVIPENNYSTKPPNTVNRKQTGEYGTGEAAKAVIQVMSESELVESESSQTGDENRAQQESGSFEGVDSFHNL